MPLQDWFDIVMPRNNGRKAPPQLHLNGSPIVQDRPAREDCRAPTRGAPNDSPVAAQGHQQGLQSKRFLSQDWLAMARNGHVRSDLHIFAYTKKRD
jgi:hypothetical protein